MFILPAEVTLALNTLNGYESYVVGGFVRDYLLGISSTDIDICTNAPIEEIMRIFKGRGKAYPKYYAYHIEEYGYTYDITSYRKELKYVKNKPVKLSLCKTLEEDLLRRDFTINTFGIDRNGMFVDALGVKKDLDDKIIRVVGKTSKKFNEDRTRIIRAIRFSCTLDFDLDTEIIKFISDKKTFMLNEVSMEYKRRELDRIFDSNGIDKFFDILTKYNISKHFNLEFDDIKPVYNKYGVWAQVKTDLPFSKEEKSIILAIRDVVKDNDIEYNEMTKYPKEVIYNAARILDIEAKIKAYEDLDNLHSIIDINASFEVFLKYINYEEVKEAYRSVERSIMQGLLENDEESIEEYLKEYKYE